MTLIGQCSRTNSSSFWTLLDPLRCLGSTASSPGSDLTMTGENYIFHKSTVHCAAPAERPHPCFMVISDPALREGKSISLENLAIISAIELRGSGCMSFFFPLATLQLGINLFLYWFCCHYAKQLSPTNPYSMSITI